MGNIIFLYPWVLFGLFIIPTIFWFRFFSKNKKAKEPHIPVSNIQAFKSGRSSLKIWTARLLPWFFMLGLCSLVIALARPQKVETITSRNVEGIDIIITLDVSDSMLIEDMKPVNRMEAAKQTLIDFVKARQNDRIGVVIFAGEAFTLVPLTLDYDLIQQRVSEITTAREANIKDGTALGVALGNAAGRLRDSTAKTRVVIFLTDGENNSGTIDPETGLEIAKGFGVRIYSIAVGKSGPTRIPVYSRDAFGNRMKSYQPFVSTVNEDLLQRMASETGGKFYAATGERSLSDVFKQIDNLERTKIEVQNYTKSTELFLDFLKWGFWIILGVMVVDIFWIRRWP